jgi:CheY-like chemotaxis protein
VASKHTEEDQSEHLRTALAKLGRPARILVADDNTTNQFVVKKMIEAFRTSIHTAANGIEAVTGTVAFAPDLILMDMRMPEMDGVEATRRIRAFGGRFATVPIIALTANAYREDIDACLEAGMTDFLSKPVRKNLLIGAMVRALDTLPAPTLAATTGLQGEHQTAYLDQDVCAQLRDAIGPDKMQEAMASFLTEARGRLDALRSLSIESDHTRLAHEANTIRDLAGTFGFTRLSDIAAWLEDHITDVPADRYADVLSQMDDALEQARVLASQSLAIAA